MEENINEQRYETTPLELFFDLIYAFAFSEVTEFIMADLTWLTLIKTLILFGAIYMVWSYTSWTATMIPTAQANGRRMILTVLLLGFFMNVSAEYAFEEQGYIFAGLYLIIQIGRSVWIMRHSTKDGFGEHCKRILVWQFITTPFWIVGMLCMGVLRVEIWGIAIIIDLIGTWLSHLLFNKKNSSADFYFDDGHMLERCRLFRIIALGEMVFSVGGALKEAHLGIMTVVLGCVSLAETISLWMLSFGRFVKIVARHREDKHNSVLVSRYAINVLFFILISIVFITIGNKYIILHAYEQTPMIIVCILGSGPLLFLVAQGWYLIKIPKVVPILYGFSIIALTMINIVALYQKAWIYHVSLGCVLVIVSFIDSKKIENFQ